MRVRWTREALSQFKHQHQYLAVRSQQAADRLVLDVTAAEALIARNPDYGRRLNPYVREWGVGRDKRFVLRYVIQAVVVSVVAFWHTAQNRPVPE